jgi:hypothetical protein
MDSIIQSHELLVDIITSDHYTTYVLNIILFRSKNQFKELNNAKDLMDQVSRFEN